MEILLIVVAVLVFLVALILMLLNNYVNDNSVKGVKSSVKPNQGVRIMYVVAHPDDEVPMSGMLMWLKSKYNAKIFGLYLTHGEDGPTGGLVERGQLKETRREEITEVGEILKLNKLTVLDYPDRYLNTQDIEKLQSTIQGYMDEYKPDYILTFDENIGMYGHPDHIIAGSLSLKAAQSSPTVQGVFQMTLSSKMIALALKLSKTFKERYDINNGLPAPNCALNIYSHAKTKLLITKAHKTQWQVMQELQPLHNLIPYPIYYLIFNREYYNYVEVGKLS